MSRLLGLLVLFLVSACGELTFGSGVPEEQDEGSGGQNDGVTSDFELPATVVDGYSYINYLRQSTGMVSLEEDSQLEVAAKGHMEYLDINNVISHDQTFGLPGFTGATPPDRAVAAGYATTWVWEGIANGVSELRAMDNLMSAIYHRFTLLDVQSDRIGMHFAMTDVEQGILVHNMSNDTLNSLCDNPVSGGLEYATLCSPVVNLSVSAVEAAQDAIAGNNPEIIVWPPEDGVDIPPVFFEETPDPLEDYSVSGYPVSAQFNVSKLGDVAVTVNHLRLYDVVAGEYVENTRFFTDTSDPRGVFEQLEATLDFALFPLERLRWGRTYRVELEYVLDGEIRTKQWQFTTRAFSDPIVRVEANDTSVNIDSSGTSYVYFVPLNGLDVISTLSSMYPTTVTPRITFEDRNTLKIAVTGNIGDTIDITLNNSRTIKLVLN